MGRADEKANVEHLRIRSQQTVRTDGTDRVTLTVFCRQRGGSTPLPVCTECEACHGFRLDKETGRGHLTCHVLRQAPESRFQGGPGMLTRVAEVMDAQVLCVEADLDIDQLIPHMLEGDIGAVPVIDEHGTPIGLTSQKAILEWKHGHATALRSDIRDLASYPREAQYGVTPRGTARDVMLPGAFALLESAPVARAAALMAYERIDHLVAISQHGDVTGILTSLAIARWVAETAGFSLPPR